MFGVCVFSVMFVFTVRYCGLFEVVFACICFWVWLAMLNVLRLVWILIMLLTSFVCCWIIVDCLLLLLCVLLRLCFIVYCTFLFCLVIVFVF